MAYTLTFGIQKGGCGKTTSTAIIAYLLAEKGYKVLVVDADPQGNLTECFLPDKTMRDHRNEGVGGILEALEKGKTRENIRPLTDNLHLLIGNELLGTFPRPGYKGNVLQSMKKALSSVQNNYNYILIDSAPALNYLLISSLNASNGVVALFETSKFCYSALFSFYETVMTVKNRTPEGAGGTNPQLDFVGILCSLVDNRRSDNRDFLSLLREDEELGDYCFDTVIQRRAATGRLPIAGFFENPELNQAIEQYRPLLKEVLSRVQA